MTTTETKAIKGGEFLIRETHAAEIFTPEDFNEEQKMIRQQCEDFLAKEVWPKLDEIDSMKNPKLMPEILDKAGELGLLGTSVPQELSGFGMDFNTSMLVAEVLGAGHSVAVAVSAHTGIGTLPILYYGSDAQKKKYIPKLATGEWKAAYCLTEPDSGSDANSGKTKAVLSKDGKHYLITGQKMWITNGGFADIYVVFAKIDNDKNLTGFIVEKSFGGITMNEEEKKMGIKGSSTRQIFFNDCPVPVENMLSERENGFKIAVNILNIGRIKLGIAAIGGSKATLSKAINYAKERKQFGTSISNFGAIKHKLAESAVKIYASESAHYRASQNIDDAYNAFVAGGMESGKARLKALEEFAIECAILKVHGSEVLDFVTDEGVQIYGGMGFSAEGPMDRAYRDARINRIFEGTNEINRLLTIDMLLKRAMKGTLDLMGPATAVQKELMGIPDFGGSDEEGLFVKEKKALANLKKAGLMAAGAAVQKFMMKLSDEQEVLMNLADMLIEGYVAESVLLRVEKLIQQRGEKACEIEKEMAIIYLHEAIEKAASAGRSAVTSFAEGDELRLMLLGLKRFTKIDTYNLKNARRKVADYMIEKGKYPF
ncbi:MAG TPA: acyl-CoA dehydrogenase family protein [Cyclobacteriaceae bacterium]|nr:acyl-CoA dehydrogenase family protein [Cyclobacteriaceae bacterium]HMV07749.1 acyl-CoA dehydrogenase family protein [Cyclobacteriaceae bacterium]HMV88017.1 acyl-CoA dehydrogenase family protein [Cyclobacteriaceae bacterium]HMW98884.1 acyl-CoA dehydrogenase family protein [Cyclobacteriaceae bacterium]HMX48483.1 acyl-CoA dehydrogenase family protein [Cyclobacteriaceae bacterium]